MKIIPVKLHKVNASKPMFVDEDEFKRLNIYKWSDDGAGYPQARVNGKKIRVHNLLIECPKGRHTDHIDGNRLNNQKQNLRICLPRENALNRGKQKDNTSGFKGVSFDRRCNRWHAEIRVNKVRYYLGYFSTPQEASESYKKAARKLHGKFLHQETD